MKKINKKLCCVCRNVIDRTKIIEEEDWDVCGGRNEFTGYKSVTIPNDDCWYCDTLKAIYAFLFHDCFKEIFIQKNTLPSKPISPETRRTIKEPIFSVEKWKWKALIPYRCGMKLRP